MRKLFLIIESQLIINIEENMVVKTKNHHLVMIRITIQKKKNINDVISYGHTWGEEWIMVSKYLPTKYLLITNREMWLYSGETGQTPSYSSDQS